MTNSENITPAVNAAEYWDKRYRYNETGWDMHQVSPPLKGYIDSLINKNISILIPGCGNAYEAQYLLDKGFQNVTLIDISQILTDTLKEKYKGEKIRIIRDDFFKHDGKYDLILEQTFFCALPPQFREQYVSKTHELLSADGKIAGVLFNKERKEEEPPYFAKKEEYEQLFSEKFDFLKLENCYNSIPPRLGNELFFIFRKK